MFSTSLFKLKSKTSQFLCKSCSLNIFSMAVIAILQSSWISSTICLEDVLFLYQCCVTHKINALDDCVRTVRPAVWDISLCLCSLRYFPAHVVPCSHMGFKHRARAGAAIVQKHWRGNKHKQTCLILPWSVPRPHGSPLCHRSVLGSACTQRPEPKPQMALIGTVPAPYSQQEYADLLW